MYQSRWATFGVLSLGGFLFVQLVCGSQSQTRRALAAVQEKKVSEKPEAEKEAEPTGDPKAGRDVFRFETFGNEGFWTDAMRLPKGMEDEKFTPLQALEAGLHVDVEAVPHRPERRAGG